MRPLTQEVGDTSDARRLWATAQEETRTSWTDVNRRTFDQQHAAPLSNELAAMARDLEDANTGFETILTRLYDRPN